MERRMGLVQRLMRGGRGYRWPTYREVAIAVIEIVRHRGLITRIFGRHALARR